MNTIMCSAVNESKIVTVDLEVAPNGKSLYVISCWDGYEWHYEAFRSFNAARKAFHLLEAMIKRRP